MKKLRLAFLPFVVFSTILGCSNNSNSPANPPSNSDSQPLEEKNYINYLGRYQTETYGGEEIVSFSYTASGFEIKINIESEQYSLDMKLLSTLFDNYQEQYINIYIDNIITSKEKLVSGVNVISSFKDLSLGEHIIRVNKLNEAAFSKIGLIGFDLQGVSILEIEKRDRKIIEFYGDSITCGYGNLVKQNDNFSMATEDGMQSYGQLTADHLGWDASIISYSGIALAMSPFNSPFTLLDKYDTVDGYKKWDFKTYTPDVVVINIGTNDNTAYRQLTGTAQEEATELFLNSYKTLMTNLKTAYPNVKIVCVTNMMLELHGFLNMCMQGAVQQLNNLYGEFAYYHEFLPNNQGSNGHPGVQAHIKNGKELADIIETII